MTPVESNPWNEPGSSKGCVSWMMFGVPINHPLRFKQHPLEDAGMLWVSVRFFSKFFLKKCYHDFFGKMDPSCAYIFQLGGSSTTYWCFYLIALKPGNCWQILTPALPQRPPIHMKSLRFWQFRFPWWGFFCMTILGLFLSDIDIVESTFWRGLGSKIVSMGISKSLFLQTFGSRDTETEASCVKLLVLLPSLKLFKIWGWTKTNWVSLYDFTAAMEKAEHLKRLREREVGRKTFPGAPNYELCECTKDYITCIFYRGIHHWVI